MAVQDLAQSRVRLVYGDRALVLMPGRYLIGRGPECHIAIDDARVSRVHARLALESSGITIEDLGSANGVFVNGQRIEQTARIVPGDSVVIGDEELRLEFTPISGSVAPPEPSVDPAPLSSAMPVRSPSKAAIPTAKSNAFDLLASVAERSLEAGRPQQAESAVRQRLVDLLDAAKAREPLRPESVERALRLALGLSRRLPARRWLDYAVELMTALAQPCSRELAAEFSQAWSAVGGTDPQPIDAWTQALRAAPSSIDTVRTLSMIEQLTKRAD